MMVGLHQHYCSVDPPSPAPVIEAVSPDLCNPHITDIAETVTKMTQLLADMDLTEPTRKPIISPDALPKAVQAWKEITKEVQ